MSKEERKLTEKEQERAVIFEKICKEMTDNGYVQKDLTVGILYANLMSLLVACPFVIILGIVYVMINPDSVSFWTVYAESPLLFGFAFFVTIIVATVLHELIHGLTWSIFTEKRWGSISFGIIWSALTPYCTCNEPLSKKQYILGSIAPTVILGLVPMLLGLAFASPFLFLVGAVMYLGGGGDMTIILKIFKFKPSGNNVLYLDHPYKVGLVVFEK